MLKRQDDGLGVFRGMINSLPFIALSWTLILWGLGKLVW